MKLRKKEKVSPIVKIWRELPNPKPRTKGGKLEPVVEAMRGNPSSKILMLAPPLDEKEYATKTPLSNENACVFDDMMEKRTGMTTSDCLVVSCSRWGLKPNKASTEDIRTFLRRAETLKQFKFYICIGDEAFKHLFGRGKKPPMIALAGNVMYVPETGYKPVFVFPSLDGLYVQENPQLSDFDNRRRLDWSEKTRIRFKALIIKLGDELTAAKLL